MLRLSTIAFGLVLAAAVTTAPGVLAQKHAGPTFNRDVAPIVFRSCAGCHRPNQVAPMSLLSYRDVRPWARAIKGKVQAREMPPWFADPQFGRFANDKSLTAAEIATISAWVDAGAPEGDGTPPPAPRFVDGGWSHPSGRPPDLVIELPVEWQIQAEGETPNFNLYTPLPFNDVRLVAATEVLPGNMAATHHIGISLVNLPPGKVLGRGPAWPDGPVTDHVAVAAPGQVPEAAPAPAQDAAAVLQERPPDDQGIFAQYIPAIGAEVLPPGHSRMMRGDQVRYIAWGLHYQPTGKPETARPKLGLWWAKPDETMVERELHTIDQTSEGQPILAGLRPIRKEAFAQPSNLNPLLPPIPPNHPNWTVTGVAAFQDDATMYGLSLHMHLRGKDVTYVLTYPDGREEILLRVPNYKFDWQLPYRFVQPLKVPAGSTLKAIGRFDNSVANRFNPAPHKEVYWSEQSWDEMFLMHAWYSVDEKKAEKKAKTTTQGND